MKATKLLEAQHREFESIFARLSAPRGEAEPLVRDLANKLAAHLTIEQELFYPAVRDVNETVIFQSYEEHALAELALKRLVATAPDDETFQAKVTALRELLEHHVDEEEHELFPDVEDAFDGLRLEQLGRQMKALYDEIVGGGYQAVVHKGDSTSADIAERRVLRKPRDDNHAGR